MGKKDQLNKIFNNSILRPFLPIANKILTRFRRGVWTSLHYNRATNRYELYENGKLINVDKIPAWLSSYSYLKSTLFRINLKTFGIDTDGIILDIGAGTGTEAIVFSEMVGPNGKVFAIEAHPETFFSLKTTMEKGNYKNVFPCQVAIGGKNGFIYIQNQSNHEKNAVSKEESDDSFKVSLITVDDFVEKHNIKRIEFLKVNIEGAELDMIEGMANSIHIIKKAAISCHDFLSNDKSMPIMNKIRSYFEQNGFTVTHIPNQHPVMNSWLYIEKNN